MKIISRNIERLIVLLSCIAILFNMSFAGAGQSKENNNHSKPQNLSQVKSKIVEQYQRQTAKHQHPSAEGRLIRAAESMDKPQIGKNRPARPMNNIANFKVMRNVDMAYGGYGGMRDIGVGTISISLSTPSATILKAYLFWHGPMNSTDPEANSAVMFSGYEVFGENIGYSDDNCWGYDNSQAYRADVTEIVSLSSGPYSLSGFVKESGSINVNGVSLIVFYDDGNSSNNHDYVLFDGNDSNIENDYDAPGWNVVLNDISYSTGDATMMLHVSDGQVWIDDTLIVNSIAITEGDSIFQGLSVPVGESAEYTNGGMWDILDFDITSLLAPGTNDLILTTESLDEGDCLSLVVAVVELPAGSAPEDFPTGKISGMKFEDANNNGLKDEGEEGISGWGISLSGPETLTTATDPNGNYIFPNLTEGAYTVSEIYESGWNQTAPVESVYAVTLDSGGVIDKLDFGNYPQPGSIYGSKWNDINGNQTWDIDEPGIAGWKIYLITVDETFSFVFLDSAYTDSLGGYSFLNLPPNIYFLTEEFQDGWMLSYPYDGFLVVELFEPAQVVHDQNFGNIEMVPGYLAGTKFNDLNMNAMRDSGEPGLSGWVIYLFADSSSSGRTVNNSPARSIQAGIGWSATTDSNGYYYFDNVPVGSWVLAEEHQENWLQSYPLTGTWSLYVSSGYRDTLLDFGNYYSSAPTGSISGLKFNDENGNGSFDEGETTIPGWPIMIEGPVTMNTETDSLGYYSFNELPPGEYTVCEKMLDNWAQTYPAGDDSCYEIELTDSMYIVSDINFGNKAINLSPLSFDRTCIAFGTVKPSETLTLPLTITNNGSEPVILQAFLSFSGAFMAANGGDSILLGGNSTTIDISFMPLEPGEYIEAMAIVTNVSVDTILLAGQGELSVSGVGQQIFAGLATMNGVPVSKYSVVLALTQNFDLIKASLVVIPPDSIEGNINYSISLQEGQAGIEAGDTIIFAMNSNCNLQFEKICGYTVFDPDFPPADGYTLHNINGVDVKVMDIPIQPGYNAVSWNVLPYDQSVQSVFFNLLNSGGVKIILDYVNNGVDNPRFDYYIPALGEYNPFQMTDFRRGYFLKTTEACISSLQVWGQPVCSSIPIPVNPGFNFVSYLPDFYDNVEHAMGSLLPDNLDVALDWVSDSSGNGYFDFYPSGGFYSMHEGKGYFVNVNVPGYLMYPVEPDDEVKAIRKNDNHQRQTRSNALPPQAVFAYGLDITMTGTIVPKGTKIQAIDRDGIVCGEAEFLADGIFALPIFADNQSTTPDEGAEQGELVSIYIGNRSIAEQVQWTEFGDTPELRGDLTVLSADDSKGVPQQFVLHKNYPNPFNPVTSIKYELPGAADVTLVIYDMLGQEVRTLVDDQKGAGYHEVTWDGKNNDGQSVSSGVYTYRLIANDGSTNLVQTQKMIMMK